MKKHRSGTQFLYRSQKASAYFGLCAAELGRDNYLRAIKYCRSSLSTEADDSDTLILLAECYTLLFNSDDGCGLVITAVAPSSLCSGYLQEARSNLDAVFRINPNIEQAAVLRRKLKEIIELIGVAR
jgi:hypothetical protein